MRLRDEAQQQPNSALHTQLATQLALHRILVRMRSNASSSWGFELAHGVEFIDPSRREVPRGYQPVSPDTSCDGPDIGSLKNSLWKNYLPTTRGIAARTLRNDSVHFHDCTHDGDTSDRGGVRFLLAHLPSPERRGSSRLANRAWAEWTGGDGGDSLSRAGCWGLHCHWVHPPSRPGGPIAHKPQI
eukprot:4836897-Pleurochrysis_carterae.AAC.1